MVSFHGLPTPESHLGLVAFLFNYIDITLHQPLYIYTHPLPEDISKIAKRESGRRKRGREGARKSKFQEMCSTLLSPNYLIFFL